MKDNFMNKNNRETFKVEWNDPKNAGLDLDQGIDYDERLAPHFTLREMCYSQTCVRLGIINRMNQPEVIIARLRTLCQKVLEPLRQACGKVVVVSGYRSDCVNYVVGGVTNSQHRLGEAADLYTPTKERAREYFDFIRNNLEFDQLLLERNTKTGHFWVHVSYTERRPNRQMVKSLTSNLPLGTK